MAAMDPASTGTPTGLLTTDAIATPPGRACRSGRNQANAADDRCDVHHGPQIYRSTMGLSTISTIGAIDLTISHAICRYDPARACRDNFTC